MRAASFLPKALVPVLSVLHALLRGPFCFAYLPVHTVFHKTRRVMRTSTTSTLATFYNDFEDFASDDVVNAKDEMDNDGRNDADLFASLRKRQAEIQAIKGVAGLDVWRTTPGKIDAMPLAKDWVRRVAMDAEDDECSQVAVGGASGSIYVIDLKTGETTGKLTHLHPQPTEDYSKGSASKTIQQLYGDYDGGGILALAKKGPLIASAGRDGGVRLSKITTTNDDDVLRSIGKVAALDSKFVTSLAFDENGMLWIGSAQNGLGMITGVDCSGLLEAEDDGTRLSVKYETRVPSGVLSMSVANEIGCGVVAIGYSGVALFSLHTGKMLDIWNPFQGDREFSRSAVLVQNDETLQVPPMKVPDPQDPTKEVTIVGTPTWSVVVGGSMGRLHQRRILVSPKGRISENKPWDDLRPPQAIADKFRHSGPIVSLVSPGPRLFLSGGQDGSIRAWDCSYLRRPTDEFDEQEAKDDNFILQVGTRPRPLFGMAGYKVWLGSMILWKKSILVTDGADNCILGHYFTGKKKAEEQ